MSWIKEKLYGLIFSRAVKKGLSKAAAAAVAGVGAFFAYAGPYMEKASGVDVDVTDGSVVITITAASLVAGALEAARNWAKHRWPDSLSWL